MWKIKSQSEARGILRSTNERIEKIKKISKKLQAMFWNYLMFYFSYNPYPFVLESEGGSITSRTYSKPKIKNIKILKSD